MEQRRRKWIGWLAAGLAVGFGLPLLGLAGTIFGMIRAFEVLGTSEVGDPSHLSAAIGEVLMATAAGIFFAIPGFVVAIVACIQLARLPKASPPDIVSQIR